MSKPSAFFCAAEGSVRRVESHELFVGALVLWAHVPRGGYGFTVRMPARVAALNLQGDVAVIEVHRKDGSRVKRRVGYKSLLWGRRGA